MILITFRIRRSRKIRFRIAINNHSLRYLERFLLKNPQSPIRISQSCLFYRRSDFFQVKTLQDITDFDIIETFNPDAAFITGLYFFDVVFKASQG